MVMVEVVRHQPASNDSGGISDQGFAPNTITFDNVSYARGGNNIIQNASFSIEAGETIAIAGVSGSGKSTLIHLLIGLLHPDSGDIYYGNKKQKEISSENWSRIFDLVAQKTVIFNDTIAQNLLCAKPSAGREELKVALQLAELSHVLDRTGKGLYEMIGDRKTNLSGGESQRIGLARVFLRFQTHNQNIIVAARAIAERKTLGHLS